MPTNAAFRRKSASTRATSVPLLGATLAAETSFQQFFWNQRFKPGFLESLDTARRSACATSATNLAPHGSCRFLIDSEKPGDIRRSEPRLAGRAFDVVFAVNAS